MHSQSSRGSTLPELVIAVDVDVLTRCQVRVGLALAPVVIFVTPCIDFLCKHRSDQSCEHAGNQHSSATTSQAQNRTYMIRVDVQHQVVLFHEVNGRIHKRRRKWSTKVEWSANTPAPTQDSTRSRRW